MDRILLVDDDPLILQALTRILKAEGYDVVAHTDPVAASAERDFVVVITDFMMPQMNGIELLGVLRAANPNAVRILLTAAADFKVASDAVNRGEIYRLLGKPWTLAELSACVKQAVMHYHLVNENRRLQKELAEKNAVLTELNRNLESLVVERTNGLLDGMISALDYRDTETQWHSRRVSLYSRRIAEEVGITGPRLDVIEQGALLHDIGKIGVRDSILLKPGKLTPEEWVEMRMHPEFGYRMLSKMPYLHEASLIVYQHQERWDGKGYPQGLAGEDIVIGARIFSVADTMDAICSDRPYRKGQPLAVAKEEIRRCAGTQFDPRIVEAYLAIPDSEWERIKRQVEDMERAEIERFGSPITAPARRQHADKVAANAQ
ncbi:MAG: HD domain-containing protein [Myxococcaceae bacterium]|nr:HD domain-containing protein [Myxococcaceae bacterium]